MGAMSWGVSPLWEYRHGFMMSQMITTSRRQGRAREDWSGGSRRANVRGDGQKLHKRPDLRASQHHMAKPIGTADKVNAALVCGNIAFLPGEICRASGDGR